MSAPAAGYVDIGGVSYPCETHEDREKLTRLKASHDAGETVDLPEAPVEEAREKSAPRSSKKK